MQQQITQQTFDEMLATLQQVLKINTIKSTAKPNMPFGEGNAKCLNFVLDKAKELGFETYNCDNYAGHVDFGDGKEVFGILGHLDVVPVKKDGWKKPPFSAEILDGFLYGRGTVDDKGPMISCLYALKQLKDEGFVPSKKIRLIFGCDEESGWGCIDYYSKKVQLPQIGFSPDGDFPVINVEKGVCHVNLDCGELPNDIIDIVGGERVNIVLDECSATIQGKLNVYRKVEENVTPSTQKEDIQIAFDSTNTTITCFGKAAHGSTPEFGDNAGWKLFKLLKTLYPNNRTISFVCDKLCSDYNAIGWGFPLCDEPSGKITVNIGYLRKQNNHLSVGLDIRFPVSYTLNDVLDNIKQHSPQGTVVTIEGQHNPLYVPKDSFLVKTLLDIFSEETGKQAQPLAVGGATYARALPMAVAFGPVFEDDEKVIHETNERISLKNLKLMTQLYYKAIKQLCK